MDINGHWELETVALRLFKKLLKRTEFGRVWQSCFCDSHQDKARTIRKTALGEERQDFQMHKQHREHQNCQQSSHILHYWQESKSYKQWSSMIVIRTCGHWWERIRHCWASGWFSVCGSSALSPQPVFTSTHTSVYDYGTARIQQLDYNGWGSGFIIRFRGAGNTGNGGVWRWLGDHWKGNEKKKCDLQSKTLSSNIFLGWADSYFLTFQNCQCDKFCHSIQWTGIRSGGKKWLIAFDFAYHSLCVRSSATTQMV